MGRLVDLVEKNYRISSYLLLLFGLLGRIWWLAVRLKDQYVGGEALNVARSVARTGNIADAFGRGSGLTAHLPPVLVVYAGYVYRIFGMPSQVSDFILSATSVITVLAAGYLLFLSFKEIGMTPLWRLGALAVFCILPLFPQLEMVTFRIWEGGLASFLAALLLYCVTRPEPVGSQSLRPWIVSSIVGSVLFFLNPAAGLAGFAMLGVWLIRERRIDTWPKHVASAAIVLAVVLAPWTIRNYEAFGRFIPLRSNMGMELALANHPGALSNRDPKTVMVDRLHEIHPQESQHAFDRMQAMGGERVYADRLGAEAKAWIVAHPTQFAELCVRHVIQFYFPPEWQWNIYINFPTRTMKLKLLLVYLVSALGLLGAVAGLLRWRGPYFYPAIMVLVPAVTYAVVQPVLRYHYLIHGITIFLGIEFVRRVVNLVLSRTRPAAQ